ncbi:hypothetical protein FB451DRAFT_1483044 [Mycena latifolia]|nr:hypothetical protein FB451DRAFT_1483044 [Mycena latifolia]
MPRRRVRFSSENIFHSPPPPPLMSPSSSSFTSSFGPSTPPPLQYAGLPGATPLFLLAPYTGPSARTGRAHNLIAQSSTPLLSYDMSLHPSSISTHYMGVSSAGLAEPAIYPPQTVISLATSYLPWAIGVVASNGKYVTVSDVLSSVYHALRTNVTLAEFNSLDTQKLMGRAAAAYTKRYERLRGHRGFSKEKMQGVKRIDFLMGHTKFQGISPGVGAPGVWKIHIG